MPNAPRRVDIGKEGEGRASRCKISIRHIGGGGEANCLGHLAASDPRCMVPDFSHDSPGGKLIAWGIWLPVTLQAVCPLYNTTTAQPLAVFGLNEAQDVRLPSTLQGWGSLKVKSLKQKPPYSTALAPTQAGLAQFRAL